MTERTHRPGEQHPEPWREDLNPDALAGENLGPIGSSEAPAPRNADEIKDLHRRLTDFTNDELRQIPILAPGTRLQQGATYIDLQDPACRVFTAMADQEARVSNWFVPKDGVDYVLWNRLIGVTNPERLDQAGEGGQVGPA